MDVAVHSGVISMRCVMVIIITHYLDTLGVYRINRWTFYHFAYKLFLIQISTQEHINVESELSIIYA